MLLEVLKVGSRDLDTMLKGRVFGGHGGTRPVATLTSQRCVVRTNLPKWFTAA